MKNIFFSTTILIITSLIFSACQFPGVKNLDKDLVDMDKPMEQEKVAATPTVEPTKSVPVAVATPSVTVAPTKPVLKTDKDKISQAMADKHSKNFADVNLKINNQVGNNASGAVSFVGEMGGGWWLASKQSGSWQIVADGNGTVMCKDLEGYSFSADMVPECWDEAGSSLVKR
jgi:hypothetical protein